MGLKKVVKNEVKSGFNVKRWLGVSQIKSSTKTVGVLFKGALMRDKKEKRKESFEQAVQRLGLSESDIRNRMQVLLKTAIGCAVLGLLVLVYMFYLLFKGMFIPSFLSLMLSAMLFAYAFREHFNYFQMRERHLGCTVKQWFHGTFKGFKK